MQQENLEQRLDAVIAPVMNEKTPGMAILIAKDDEILIRKAYGMADLENGRPITPEVYLLCNFNAEGAGVIVFG